MSSEHIAISAEGLSKCYQMYEKPAHRLLQFVMPILYEGFSLEHDGYSKEFWALRGVSFEVAKGETFAVVGRNGSGKSTLLQLICGTLAPTSGKVGIHGKVAALLELGSGFNPEFTGRENVFLNGAVFGLSREQMQARFDDIVAFADIGNFIDQPLKTYSSGMGVRLAFSVAMHVDADILIVDEALAVGDFAFQSKCVRRLKDFVAGGGTLLFVSHDISAVKNLCRRAVYLRDGQVRAIGASEEVCDLYLTETHFDEGLAGGAVRNDERGAHATQPDLAGVEAFRRTVAPFRRHASSACEFVGVAITDGTGRHISSADWGDELNVHAWLSVNESIDHLVIAFYLRDRLQIDVMGTNTQYEGIELTNLKPGERIEVVFSFKNYLRAGEYGVCLIAADTSITTNTFYDWIDLAASLKMEDRSGQVAWALFNPAIATHAKRTDS